jgi:hypothetical protein
MALSLANAVNGIQSTIVEQRNTLIPYLPSGISFSAVGVQTTPPFSRQTMFGTVTAQTNSDLAHSCDFKFTINANTDLSLGIIDNPVTVITKAIADGKNAAAAIVSSLIGQAIDAFRITIKGIIVALNFDPSGEISTAVSTAKKYIREINEKLKEIAEYVAVASLYYNLIKQIQQIVDFIKTLPAKVLALIQGCFTNFTNAIKDVAAQAAAIPGAAVGGLAGVLSQLNTSSQSALLTVQDKVASANVPDSLIAIVTSPSTANVDALSAHITDNYTNLNVNLGAGFDSANTTPP